MNRFPNLVAWLPQIDRRLWILIIGRLLLQTGTGFVLFYAAVFFVQQVGLTPSAVGFGLGSESISGVVGRIFGGSLSDSPRWGRRKVLLMAAAIAALADLVLAVSNNFSTFLLGNLLMGLGIGLYWPATEAVVADLTHPGNRNEAYALNRLADNLGLGMGVVFGGWLIAATGAYRAMFVIDSISFLIFLGVIYKAVPETLNRDRPTPNVMQGWRQALRDRPLQVFVAANVLFTTYLALLNSALPLYLTRFVSATPAQTYHPAMLSLLFSWYIGLCVFCQMPIVRFLKPFDHAHALRIPALNWALGFGFIWWAGQTNGHPIWIGIGLAIMAIATVAYNPSASSLIIRLAPESLRGVYLSVNSLCWAAGYFIGPTIGGWAMGESRSIANGFWLGTIGSVGVVLLLLQWLDRKLKTAGDQAA